MNVRVYTGYSPLHLAAEHGHANIVNYLLQHGAQQDVRSEHGLTPIFLAANFGHIDCLKCLLRHAKEKGNIFIEILKMTNLFHSFVVLNLCFIWLNSFFFLYSSVFRFLLFMLKHSYVCIQDIIIVSLPN